MSDQIIAELRASAPRRFIATAILGALGLLLLWLGATAPAAPLWKVTLLAAALASIFGAVKLWMATSAAVLLTCDGLELDDGTVLARMDQIASVDRGAFAIKPSNGFLVRLNEPMPFGWAPGLWWRGGKRIGLGGVTGAAQGKSMADLLALRLSGDL